jgi:Ni/Co efflux regulator RcnB
MKKLAITLLTTMTAATALTVMTTAPADAAVKKYSSCARLVKDYPHGVARSAKAARKQVRQGYGEPAHGKKAKKVYRKNKANLDRDKDGTACER